MAEGGNCSRTLEDGSEDIIDHECLQCRADGSKQEATDFCQDCKELLCKVCGKYHVRNMKTHTLVSLASMTQTNTVLPTASPAPVVAKCPYHPEREIEMYCGTHDMVYCCLCVAKEHRSCVNVQEIKEVAHTSQLSTLQTLVDVITRVNKRLRDTKQEQSHDLKLVKQHKPNLLQEIDAVRKRMNKHLDALEQKIITELDAEQNKREKEINADIMIADDLITSSDQRKPDLTRDYDGKQLFIIEKLARDVLEEAISFLKSANVSKRPTLTFEQNDELCDAIEKLDCMGSITRIDGKSKHSNCTVTHNNAINVKVNSDKKKCYISGLCQLPDGTILLTDRWNKKLKRLDDQLNVKDFLKFKSEPMGLCSVSPTEVAVRMRDENIELIDVGGSLSYLRDVYYKSAYSVFRQPYGYRASDAAHGMACCNKQLWIPGDDAVYVISLFGKVVKEIKTDFQGQEVFSAHYPEHIAVSNDKTKVYVTAGEDRVVVFNSDGDVIEELRDERLRGTRGICITEDGIVCVAGYSSNNVVMFDRDGTILGEFVSADLLSLCYDSKRCRLLAGYESDNAQLFQLI